MPVYRYIAKSSPTSAVRGEMQAESVNALVAKLGEMGLYPVDVAPVKEEQVLRKGFLKTPGRLRMGKLRMRVANFTRQLGGMLSAGLTLHAAISLLQKQAPEGSIKHVLKDIAERLKDGQRFSEACSAWPRVFSDFYVNMIRAGEAGGMLELILNHLADFLEKEDEVRKQIQAALVYPALMFFMGFVTVTILMTFVVPRIVSMFDEIGQSLPLPTKILIAISHTATHDWPLFLLALVAGILVWRIKKQQASFLEKMDQIKLRLPFFGPLIVQGEISQFARILGALLAHGVPIYKAFEVVIASCKNRVLQNAFKQTAETIRQGGRMGSSMLASPHLPPLLGEMISVAEDTNQLESVLDKIATASAKEVERRVALFTRMLEPAMILLLGLVIGFIVFAMMLPIFQMDFVVQ